jgi:DNA-directed RNA polymerase I, II, and III subunit RPABC2
MADDQEDYGDNDYDEGLAGIEEEEAQDEDLLLDGDTQQQQQREIAKESRAFQFLNTHHPECRLDYIDDVLHNLALTSYPPNLEVESNHKSVPYLTLFEKTKLIGFRANQIAQGARALIQVPNHITDVLEIARLELEQKRLPYILKRPMPDGTFEYIRLADLIII